MRLSKQILAHDCKDIYNGSALVENPRITIPQHSEHYCLEYMFNEFLLNRKKRTPEKCYRFKSMKFPVFYFY